MKTNTDNRTEERKNRFNGESVMLTKEEARRHDCIFLAEVMATPVSYTHLTLPTNREV